MHVHDWESQLESETTMRGVAGMLHKACTLRNVSIDGWNLI